MLGLIAAVILAAAAPETASSEAAGPPTPAKAAEAGEEPPRAAPEKKKKSPRDERVCWDRTPVGTRFSQRVCATRSDLEERRRRDQDMVRTVRTAPTPSD